MKESELILNPDGSIYHLALLPEDIAPTIILVGDQDRVQLVSQHFDRIEVKKQRREFITHTGRIGDKRISVISTGIGTDNIDIVLNELDALVNIDFITRTIKTSITSLTVIRIGTSGSIHPDVHLDDILVSRYAMGTDSTGQYYGIHESPHKLLPAWSYMVKAHYFDLQKFPGPFKEGITLTCPGFYAAQGRALRLSPEYKLPLDQLQDIQLHGFSITNLEMETAGIYLLAEKLGHKAISFNAILANRLAGKFSTRREIVVNELIKNVLQWNDNIT